MRGDLIISTYMQGREEEQQSAGTQQAQLQE